MAYCLVSQLFSQVTWNKTYKFLNSTAAHALFEKQNGELVVGGSTFASSSSASREMFILNVNVNTGDSIQANQCPSGPSVCAGDRLYIQHLFENPQGELYSISESIFSPNPILAKHNNGLETEWTSFLRLDTIHYVNAVVAFSSGFVFAGQFSGNDYIVQKRDYQGKKIWSRRIFVSQIGMEPQLVGLPNDQVAVLYKDGLNFGQTYLEAFDQNGKSLWRKSATGIYSIASSPQDPHVYTIEGSRTAFGTYLIKKHAASSGQIVWETTKEDRFFSATALAVDAQGQVYIGGSLAIEGSGTFFSLAKLDATGKFLWRIHFEKINFTLFQKMLITKDQEIALLVSYNNASSIRVAKIKGTGLVSALKDSNPLPKLQIAPNPVQDILSIQSEELDLQNFSYQIATSSGKKLAHGQLNTSRQNIDVSNFPKGVYFLIFTGENGQSFARKIIKL